MSSYHLWGYLHILLFVFWLGADVGVFLGALVAKDRTLGFEARMTAMKLSMTIDLFPRVSFALMPAAGLHLTAALGLYEFPAWVLAATWLLALTWIAAILAIGKYAGTPFADRLSGAQLVSQIVAGILIAGIGLKSLIDGTPLTVTWFALKIFLFGCVFLAAVAIDLCFRPAIQPFIEIGRDGSTPAREAAVTIAINRTLVAVLTLYALIAAIAFVGKVKPV